LWRDGERASISDLARLTGVSFAGANLELRAMQDAGLSIATRAGSAMCFEANTRHPLAGLLRDLVAAGGKPAMDHREDDDARTRGWLVGLGAPLHHEGRPRGEAPAAEKVIARGLELAHRDASVARSLPICIFRKRFDLDPTRLELEARELGEKQALGFFLELTADLSGDELLHIWSRRMVDRRIRRERDFFPAS